MSSRRRGVMRELLVSAARTSSSAVVRLWPVFDCAARSAWPSRCVAGEFRLWGTWRQGLPLRMMSAAPERVVGVAVDSGAHGSDVCGSTSAGGCGSIGAGGCTWVTGVGSYVSNG